MSRTCEEMRPNEKEFKNSLKCDGREFGLSLVSNSFIQKSIISGVHFRASTLKIHGGYIGKKEEMRQLIYFCYNNPKRRVGRSTLQMWQWRREQIQQL